MRKGFTLIEVLVVAVIVAILAAVVIPAYNGYINTQTAKYTMTYIHSDGYECNMGIKEFKLYDKFLSYKGIRDKIRIIQIENLVKLEDNKRFKDNRNKKVFNVYYDNTPSLTREKPLINTKMFKDSKSKEEEVIEKEMVTNKIISESVTPTKIVEVEKVNKYKLSIDVTYNNDRMVTVWCDSYEETFRGGMKFFIDDELYYELKKVEINYFDVTYTGVK